jgi:hypothetical protein
LSSFLPSQWQSCMVASSHLVVAPCIEIGHLPDHLEIQDMLESSTFW